MDQRDRYAKGGQHISKRSDQKHAHAILTKSLRLESSISYLAEQGAVHAEATRGQRMVSAFTKVQLPRIVVKSCGVPGGSLFASMKFRSKAQLRTGAL